jgi:protein-disulfide isomerase
VTVSDGAIPSRGPANAPITIVEFSDFHCPFCRRVAPTLRRVLEKYPTQVRLVYRDIPVDGLHPQARKAAEAARCANDQGKFWEFHDRIYAGPTDSSAATLKALAEQSGLDAPQFEQCVANDVHKAAVQADVEYAGSLGVTGTPTFFVNGRVMVGAQPYEAFVQLIEDELALAKGSPSIARR